MILLQFWSLTFFVHLCLHAHILCDQAHASCLFTLV